MREAKKKGFLKRIRRESKDFTLGELLIVIAILGVLAAVPVDSQQGSTRQC